ncbi:polysaccharide lyase family 1 protein [Armillaria borealis]|uniref:Polysaccharide lyase family 1 protein n=1 Tax=Armillaria borealis TaxID=47425 RepID=A0AA39MPS4_9AGAR|nr:polysaccharide lyase family 1 protein [Armillaria borealis]
MWLCLFVALLAPLRALSVDIFTGDRETLPQLHHTPFGYGGASTGGSTNKSSIYVVSNHTELREALALPFTKTIYVNGTIEGNQLDNGTLATCEYYTAATSGASSQFDFILYLLSLNATYISLVEDAISQNVTFEGKNATEYRALLGHQNGWRPVVSNTQKAQVGFTLTNNTSLIGMGKGAALNGINLYLSSVNNIWIRNLKLVSPADCFPAPETFPSSWNARFDAVGLVTAMNVWVDGCELQDQLSGEYVQPDIIDPGWQVDRFDGLFDCEDGTDNVTFSHNIVRNHHKSLLLGGGTKEAPRDLGKMHFTIFGNHFNNSASRNPTMRFGTFDVYANLFEDINDNQPRFGANLKRDEDVPLDAVFEYHLGVYNQSTVQLRDNVFLQSGKVPDDTSRIFTISEATIPELPARVCIRDSSVPPTLNGADIDLGSIAQDTVDWFVDEGDSAKGAVLMTCKDVAVGDYQTFGTVQEVARYVLREAGQSS